MLATILATTTTHAGDAAASAATAIGVGFIIVLWMVIGGALYFLPSIVGFGRKRPNAGPILVLNIFLGWSLIGWVVSLVWALTSDRPAQQVIITQVAQPLPTSA